MSNIFRFDDKPGVKLDLNGVEFTVDVTEPAFLKRLETFGQNMVKSGSNEKFNSTDTINEAMIEVMEMCQEGIDSILGNGSTANIFGKREVNFLEISQLSFFIIEKIKEYIDNEFQVKYSPQRIKR